MTTTREYRITNINIKSVKLLTSNPSLFIVDKAIEWNQIISEDIKINKQTNKQTQFFTTLTLSSTPLKRLTDVN